MRILPRDTGLWKDAQIAGWRQVTDFVHAGRKASTNPVFVEERRYVYPAQGEWQTLGTTDADFGNGSARRRGRFTSCHRRKSSGLKNAA